MLLHAQRVAEYVEFGVAPFAPLLGIDRAANLIQLVRRCCRQDGTRSLGHCFDRRAVRLEREEATAHVAVAGNALERLGEQPLRRRYQYFAERRYNVDKVAVRIGVLPLKSLHWRMI